MDSLAGLDWTEIVVITAVGSAYGWFNCLYVYGYWNEQRRERSLKTRSAVLRRSLWVTLACAAVLFGALVLIGPKG